MATQARGFVEGQTCIRGNTSKQLHEADLRKSQNDSKKVKAKKPFSCDLFSTPDSDSKPDIQKAKLKQNDTEKRKNNKHQQYSQVELSYQASDEDSDAWIEQLWRLLSREAKAGDEL